MTAYPDSMPRKPLYPRDAPGSFVVPTTKGGKIQRMVGLTGYMEIYTEHETFRFQTPETTDPSRTNPNAMFVQTKVAEVGASDPHVARTIVMAHEMLSSGIVLKGDKLAAMLLQVHRIKETLSQCLKAVEAFSDAVREENERFLASAAEVVGQGRMLAYFPVIQDLDAKTTAFLIPARRLITEVCQIPGGFWSFERAHSDPSHLLEKAISPSLGSDHLMVPWLTAQLSPARTIIDFRNGQEHPATTKSKKLTVRNFEMAPSNDVVAPSWALEGTDLTDTVSDLATMMAFLIDFSEGMFVGCVAANLPNFPPMKMYAIEQPDPVCPVRYTLQIDGVEFAKLIERNGLCWSNFHGHLDRWNPPGRGT